MSKRPLLIGNVLSGFGSDYFTSYAVTNDIIVVTPNENVSFIQLYGWPTNSFDNYVEISANTVADIKETGNMEIGAKVGDVVSAGIIYGLGAAYIAHETGKDSIHIYAIKFNDGQDCVLKTNASGAQILQVINAQILNKKDSNDEDVFQAQKLNININPDNVEPTIKRMEIYMEDKEWLKAKAYCEAALDYFPDEYRLYIISLLLKYKASNLEELFKSNDHSTLTEDINYKRARQFGGHKFENDIKNALNNNKEEEANIINEDYKSREDSKVLLKNRFVTDENCLRLLKANQMITTGLKADGHVVAVGYNKSGQCDVSDWNNIIDVVCSESSQNVMGLKADGTVVATGSNQNGECNISSWYSIKKLAIKGHFLVGLKEDGTVVTTNNRIQQEISGWEDIKDISTSYYSIIGIKSDGTVISHGKYSFLPPGDSYYEKKVDVSTWNKIVKVISMNDCTIGLCSNGTVIFDGYNYKGKCNVSDWKDIIDICSNFHNTIGLKADGTVVATGDNEYGQCDVSDWRNIIAIAIGDDYTVGLKSDGTVVATGDNECGQCNVSDWNNIIDVSAFSHTVGLKSDGTVVATGDNEYGQCNVSSWKLFENYDSIKDTFRNKESLKEKFMIECKLQNEQELKERISSLTNEKISLEEELPNIKGLFANSKRKQITDRIQEIEEELSKLL